MATNLGTAYVQIMPSAKGIKGSIQEVLDPEAKESGKSAGESVSGGLVSVMKKALVAAGIGKAIMSSLTEGGKLQQSIGGVKTLFGDFADNVTANASQSFKTTGLSANEYMENVTSFSAALIKSLGGDTKKAAEISNTAMIDMADNSNKMGTAMGDIQNAYQGFAKQNYTMLDNLKLGYGGTKQEMQRLLDDATKISHVKYDINNLSDVYEAIHVVQKDLGIMGATSQEASTTLSGSFNAMKGAFQDFIGNLAIGADITVPLQNLATTAATFFFGNFLPMLGNIISAIPQAIATIISAAIPVIIEQGGQLLQSLSTGMTTQLPLLLQTISDTLGGFLQSITDVLPQVLESGSQMILNLASGILQNAPSVLSGIGDILASVLDFLLTNIPVFLEKGFELIAGLAKGLLDNLPAVVSSITSIIQKLLGIIIDNFPNIVSKGFELIGKMASGLLNNLPSILSAIGRILASLIKMIVESLPKLLDLGVQLIAKLAAGLLRSLGGVLSNAGSVLNGLKGVFTGAIGQMFSIGSNLIRGLWNGIRDVKGWILGKIRGFVDGIVGGIKSFFGINSPSRVFAEVGEYLDLGLAKGILDNTKPVGKAMGVLEDAATGDFESSFSASVKSNLAQRYDEMKDRQQDEVMPTSPSMNLILRLGNSEFKAFVEDISKAQNNDVKLKLSYN
ncbi:MAG: hypothetical protein PT957_03865 [Firmicutes bacterium]|nr:hypothetical protein [Bacillota bacterium]